MASAVMLAALSAVCSVGAVRGVTDYCGITQQHTMCLHRGVGPHCGPYYLARGVTRQEAAAILDVHNLLRSRLASGQEAGGSPGPQPPAADMMQLEWDVELATIAQRHADQCDFQHDCNACREVEEHQVGQNLFLSTSDGFLPGADWGRAVRAWYGEVALHGRRGAPRYRFAADTGHFTQLVWAKTAKVGCGFIFYRSATDALYNKLYTCDYGPAGNVPNTAVYTVGPPCSLCSTCSQQYPGLCTTTRIPHRLSQLAYFASPLQLISRLVEPAEGNVMFKERQTNIDPNGIKPLQFHFPTNNYIITERPNYSTFFQQQSPLTAAVQQQSPLTAALQQQSPLTAAVQQQSPLTAALQQKDDFFYELFNHLTKETKAMNNGVDSSDDELETMLHMILGGAEAGQGNTERNDIDLEFFDEINYMFGDDGSSVYDYNDEYYYSYYY